MDYNFANPEFLYGLFIIPLIILWYIFRSNKQNPSIIYPASEIILKIKPSIRQRFRHLPFLLRILSLSFIIIALARPQSSSSEKNVSTEGIDIVISLDVSTSMLAEDFKPNRFEAAKKTALQFIENRKNDRIGLIIFAGESFTQCPITIDHSVLKNLLTNVKSGEIQDGTAIGDGLATAVARLRKTDAKSKVVILITDGVNNMGNIAPITAAEIAQQFNVKVYTIGVGTKGKAPYPQQFRNWLGQTVTQYVYVDVQIDEELLKQISGKTGGKYFRATNNKALENIYAEIDQMEKVKIDVAYFTRFSEEFLIYAIPAFILFLLEQILRYTVFRKLP